MLSWYVVDMRIPFEIVLYHDPQNFHLLGLPPADILEEVAAAWRAEGLDVFLVLGPILHFPSTVTVKCTPRKGNFGSGTGFLADLAGF